MNLYFQTSFSFNISSNIQRTNKDTPHINYEYTAVLIKKPLFAYGITRNISDYKIRQMVSGKIAIDQNILNSIKRLFYTQKLNLEV